MASSSSSSMDPALARAYTLALLPEYAHTLSTLPIDLCRSYADLRELYAVLSSSLASLTEKIQTLTRMLEASSPPSTPEERLWLLTVIAGEASRLKIAGEDKISVANQAADTLRGHQAHLRALAERVPGLDTRILLAGKTVYPHVTDNIFMPVLPVGQGGGGRRQRRGAGGLLVGSATAEPSPKKKRRREREIEYDGDDPELDSIPKPPPKSRKKKKAVEEYVYGDSEPPQMSFARDVPPPSASSSHPSLSLPVAGPSYQPRNGRNSTTPHLAGPGIPPPSPAVPVFDVGANAVINSDEVNGDDGEVDNKVYCFCDGAGNGSDMVACDDDGCEREWFHLTCVGLDVAPLGDIKWFCDECKARRRGARGGASRRVSQIQKQKRADGEKKKLR